SPRSPQGKDPESIRRQMQNQNDTPIRVASVGYAVRTIWRIGSCLQRQLDGGTKSLIAPQSYEGLAERLALVPTLRVGTHAWTLRVPMPPSGKPNSLSIALREDAERRFLRSHAGAWERGKSLIAPQSYVRSAERLALVPTLRLGTHAW